MVLYQLRDTSGLLGFNRQCLYELNNAIFLLLLFLITLLIKNVAF